MFSVSAEVVYFLKNISLAHVCTPVNMETQYFQLLKSCIYWCHVTCWNLNSQSRCWSKRLHNVAVYLSSHHSTLEAMFHWHHLGTQCVNPPIISLFKDNLSMCLGAAWQKLDSRENGAYLPDRPEWSGESGQQLHEQPCPAEAPLAGPETLIKPEEVRG